MGPDRKEQKNHLNSVFQDIGSQQVQYLGISDKLLLRLMLLVCWREVLKSKTLRRKKKSLRSRLKSQLGFPGSSRGRRGLGLRAAALLLQRKMLLGPRVSGGGERTASRGAREGPSSLHRCLGEGCQAAGSPGELLKVPTPDTHIAAHVSRGWPEKQNPQDA